VPDDYRESMSITILGVTAKVNKSLPYQVYKRRVLGEAIQTCLDHVCQDHPMEMQAAGLRCHLEIINQ